MSEYEYSHENYTEWYTFNQKTAFELLNGESCNRYDYMMHEYYCDNIEKNIYDTKATEYSNTTSIDFLQAISMLAYSAKFTFDAADVAVTATIRYEHVYNQYEKEKKTAYREMMKCKTTAIINAEHLYYDAINAAAIFSNIYDNQIIHGTVSLSEKEYKYISPEFFVELHKAVYINKKNNFLIDLPHLMQDWDPNELNKVFEHLTLTNKAYENITINIDFPNNTTNTQIMSVMITKNIM